MDEGLALLDEAARKAHPVHLHCPLALGQALLQAGRQVEARTIAADVASKSRRSGDRGMHAWALRLEGEIAVSAGAAARAGKARTALEAEAEARYGGALALATELGMRPLVAHCHLGLGALSTVRDGDLRPPDHLAAAATLFRKMGMGYWQGQAETALVGVVTR